jgi:hypothetical protein
MRGRTWAPLARTSIAVLSLLLFTAPVPAGATEADIGTYGAAFLQIPVGARLMATPDVVAGMRPDASFLFSNPALLAGLERREIFLSSASWLEDLSVNAVSAVVPLSSYGLNWSLGSRIVYSGGLQGYNAASQVVDEQSYYDVAFTTGLSRRFESVGLSVGADVTYIREHLFPQDGNGYTFSLGASYERAGNRFDVFARDLGGTISFAGNSYPIDARYVLGYGRALRRTWGTLDLGTQVTFSRSQYKRLQFGASYAVNSYFTLRSGFDHAFQAPDNAPMPLSAGLGFHFGDFNLDYAYTSQQYFSATHTFSIGFQFGRPGGGGDMPMPRPVKAEKAPVRNPGLATPVEPKQQPKPVTPKAAPPKTSYLIIAGIHGRLESANAEVHALRLLKIPAVTEETSAGYRVVIARFSTLKSANAALDDYAARGHRFTLITEAE